MILNHVNNLVPPVSETEAWIIDNPDHLIHFNGHKFLGPFSVQDC